MEQNKRKEILSFCLGILLIGCLIQTAGWLRDDRLVFPDVFEILRAFFRLLTKAETYQKIWVTLRHLVQAMLVST